MKHIKLFEEFSRETLDYENFSKLYDIHLDEKGKRRMFNDISNFLENRVYSPTGNLLEAIDEMTEKLKGESVDYDSKIEYSFATYSLIKYKLKIGGQEKHVAVIDESQIEKFSENPYIFFVNADDVDYMKEKLYGHMHGKNYGI